MSGGFLLDTNVVSEVTRSRIEPRVQNWVAARDFGVLLMSVVTVGEMHKGLTLMTDVARRERLEAWLERQLTGLFQGQVLPVTQSIAERWGRLDGIRQLAGHPLSVPDGMIAATAQEHGLTVVTRNAKDFTGLGVAIVNPWED